MPQYHNTSHAKLHISSLTTIVPPFTITFAASASFTTLCATILHSSHCYTDFFLETMELCMWHDNTKFILLTHFLVAFITSLITWRIRTWWNPRMAITDQYTFAKKTDGERPQRNTKTNTYVYMPNGSVKQPEVFVTQHGLKMSHKFHVNPYCPTLHSSSLTTLSACTKCKHM